MLDRNTLLARLDEAACLDFVAQMVRHNSLSATPGEAELARWMVQRMRDIGMKADLQPVAAERHNAIGRLRGIGGGNSLLFNGHIDTNPVTEGWTVDPWGGVVDDNFIYGIGVSNMKAGDAAYFCAVRALLEAGVKLRGDVILTFVAGELQGGIGTLAAIDQGITADYFINSEPTDLRAITMHAGSLKFTIELTGITRHLSKREEAVDALAAACDLVPTLNGMVFSGAETAAQRAVNRVHVGVLRAALSREFHDWRPPQVADFAMLKGSGRYAPGQTAEGALADMRAVLDDLECRHPGLKAHILLNTEQGFPPFEVSPQSRIVKAVNDAYRIVRGVEQPTGPLSPAGYYGTDAAHLYQRLGLQGVVCGPGGRYNTMPDERVDRADYLDMIRVYMLVILDICQPV